MVVRALFVLVLVALASFQKIVANESGWAAQPPAGRGWVEPLGTCKFFFRFGFASQKFSSALVLRAFFRMACGARPRDARYFETNF